MLGVVLPGLGDTTGSADTTGAADTAHAADTTGAPGTARTAADVVEVVVAVDVDVDLAVAPAPTTAATQGSAYDHAGREAEESRAGRIHRRVVVVGRIRRIRPCAIDDRGV